MTLVELLRRIELGVFLWLGLVAAVRWYQHRGKARFWVAVSFITLATICVVGQFLPSDPSKQPPLRVLQGVVGLIILFPFFLYMFMETFDRPKKWVQQIARVLTTITLIYTLAISHFPTPTEHRTVAFSVFAFLVVGQWLFLLGTVAFRLWNGGKHQGVITQQRMRTLSMGSVGIAIALVVTALNKHGSQNHGLTNATSVIAILSGPLFLLGFSPPAFIVRAWRGPERERFRQAEGGLIEAVTPNDVARVLLPFVASYVGGSKALLANAEGGLIGFYGYTHEEALDVAAQTVVDNPNKYEMEKTSDSVTVAFAEGTLVVGANAYSPFFGKEETSLIRSFASFTDMALARVRLTEAQLRIAEDLRLKNAEMRDFVAMASHDIRAPIGIIEGFVNMLQGDWPSLSENQKQDSLSVIARQSHHLSRLVDDLLTASSLDANAIEHGSKPLLVREVLDNVNAQFLTKQFEIVPENFDNELMILGNLDHTVRILRNYVENAVTYGRSPVSIEIDFDAEFVSFKVRDNGSGIPAEFVPRVFDRFARGPNSESTRGTGLGLAIVKGLAEVSKGEVWYEDNTPHGSCFGVRLPRYVRTHVHHLASN